MSIVSISDVTTYMGGDTLTQGQRDFVSSTVIPGVQQELETYLNTPVELVQVRESLTPETDGYIYFTYAPVRRVLSVVWSAEGAVPLTLTQYVPPSPVPDPSVGRPVIDRTAPAATSSSYRYQVGLQAFPGVILASNYVPYVVVDYIAGTDASKNAGLKLAMLRVIAREVERVFDTSSAIRSGNLEPATQSDTRIKGWSLEELKAWDRLKRRVIL